MVIEKDLIERIDRLIRMRASGSPAELAEKLEISSRQLYRLINNMKELNCPVVYDKYIRSYKYEQEGRLILSFSPLSNDNKSRDIIDKDDLNNIKGGFCENKSLTDRWWQWRNLYLLRDVHKMFN